MACSCFCPKMCVTLSKLTLWKFIRTWRSNTYSFRPCSSFFSFTFYIKCSYEFEFYFHWFIKIFIICNMMDIITWKTCNIFLFWIKGSIISMQCLTFLFPHLFLTIFLKKEKITTYLHLLIHTVSLHVLTHE
jgi:hypothetical protein